jgi:hypothetical protein
MQVAAPRGRMAAIDARHRCEYDEGDARSAPLVPLAPYSPLSGDNLMTSSLTSLSGKLFLLLQRFALLAVVLSLAAVSLPAADGPEILPLDQIKPGMTGYARTIFAGDQIENFDLVVIGVLPNLIGPKQDIILVQLKGPKVEHTGVVAGMSGSPVYINGKLAGAVSLKFGMFVKEPLAGVTPIESMLALPTQDAPPRAGTAVADSYSLPSGDSLMASAASSGGNTQNLRFPLPVEWTRAAGIPGGGFLEPIDTPLVFSGFAPATIRQYSADWAQYGMVATPGGTTDAQPDDAQITPGDMVSMVLVQGDISLNAACTVTAIVEDRVYVCGHPFLGLGATKMPMARGRVLTTLSSDFESTKIVNAGGVIGTITQDRVTAVMGKMGPAPAMIPVDLSFTTPNGEKKYNMEMISNPKITPLLVGLVSFNGLTQNTTYGEGTTLRLSGSIEIKGHSPVSLDDMYAPTDQFVPDGEFVAGSVQSIFARIFSNPYETPQIERVTLRLDSIPERRIATVESAWSEMSEASPGDPVVIKVMLRPYRGAPFIRDVPITIPPQAARGTTLRVQVSDSDSLNRLANLFTSQGRLGGLEQLITLLNHERRNNELYVTLMKPTPTLMVDDKELPNAPLSEINVMDQRRLPGNSVLLRESSAGEWSVPMDEVIAGSASVLIKIK